MVRGDIENSNWHHLDDDPSHAAYANFIPVGSSINTALRDARKEASGGTVASMPMGELMPDALLHQAAVWHAKWESGLAYGCARLSYYVATRYLYEPPNRALRRACDAFYYARHRYDGTLLEDILVRDILPQVEDDHARTTIGGNTAGLILAQLAGVCGEFGMPAHAAEIFQKGDKKLGKTGSSDDLREAALVRRRAMVAGTLGAPACEVDAQLRESISLASDNPNAGLSAMMTKAWLLERDEDWAAVARLLEPLYRRYRPLGPDNILRANGMTAWNLGELFYAYGAALAVLARQRSKGKVEEVMANAQVQFARSGARPYEIMPGHRLKVIAHLSAAGVGGPQLPHAGKPMPRLLESLISRIIVALDS